MLKTRDMLDRLQEVKKELEERLKYAPKNKAVQMAKGQVSAAITWLGKIGDLK